MRPTALAIHQTRDRLYVLDPPLGRLTEFNLVSGEQSRRETIGFGSSDIAVAPAGEALYVAQPYLSRLVVLDPATLEKVADIPLRFGVSTLAVDKARRRLYAASLTNGYLFAIDTRSRTVLDSVPVATARCWTWRTTMSSGGCIGRRPRDSLCGCQ
jgi:DNA-binding beta-propeller fold protein YncE